MKRARAIIIGPFNGWCSAVFERKKVGGVWMCIKASPGVDWMEGMRFPECKMKIALNGWQIIWDKEKREEIKDAAAKEDVMLI